MLQSHSMHAGVCSASLPERSPSPLWSPLLLRSGDGLRCVKHGKRQMKTYSCCVLRYTVRTRAMHTLDVARHSTNLIAGSLRD